jgi:hypothetical protein
LITSVKKINKCSLCHCRPLLQKNVGRGSPFNASYQNCCKKTYMSMILKIYRLMGASSFEVYLDILFEVKLVLNSWKWHTQTCRTYTAYCPRDPSRSKRNPAYILYFLALFIHYILKIICMQLLNGKFLKQLKKLIYFLSYTKCLT